MSKRKKVFIKDTCRWYGEIYKNSGIVKSKKKNLSKIFVDDVDDKKTILGYCLYYI